jgi:hypothetical protein
MPADARSSQAMNGFSRLELAAMRSIFAEVPEHAAVLEEQLRGAEVASRENTGHGFFTGITLEAGAPPVPLSGPLGECTRAHVRGFETGLGFLIFLKDGRCSTLEGYAFVDDTSAVDLTAVDFAIYNLEQGELPPSPFGGLPGS